jgi:uncharacterized protein YfdQ (DUF2303 family)
MTTETEELRKDVNAAEIHNVDGHNFIVVPNDHQVEDLEKFASSPKRVEKVLECLTTESLIAYVTRFGEEPTSLFADETRNRITAIIDYHINQGTPDWCKHKAYYSAELSKEWEAWERFNNSYLGQEEFAEFLEDRIADIVEPTGAELLSIASQFRLIRKATFGSAKRSSTGEFQFEYKEENESGTIEVPEVIKLGIAPFKNGQSYEVEARLRYRLREGILKFSYKLIDPERVVEDAFQNLVNQVEEGLAEYPVYRAAA